MAGETIADAPGGQQTVPTGNEKFPIDASTGNPGPDSKFITLNTVTGFIGTVINVVNYGALGDGTTDNSIAIQAACNAAANNAVIWFPPGVFGIGATGVSVSGKTGISFQGTGSLKLLATPTNALSGFGFVSILFTNCTRCEVRGMTILGNGNGMAVGMNGCTEGGFFNNNVSGCNSTIESGQLIALGGTNQQFLGNTLHDSGLGNVIAGLWVGGFSSPSSDKGSVISGNATFNNTGDGIVYVGTNGRVENNLTYSNLLTGIVPAGTSAFMTSNVIISGNICYSNTTGIYTDAADGSPMSGGVVTGNICFGNSQAGIQVYKAAHWTLSGNQCFDNLYGIAVNDIASDICVTGNSCYDTRSGGSRTQTVGIFCVANLSSNTMDNLSFTGNNCYNNSQQGIQIQTNSTYNIKNVTVVGGIYSDNGNFGVQIAETGAGTLNGSISGAVALDNTSVDINAQPLNFVVGGGNVYSTSNDLEYYTVSGTTPNIGLRNQLAFSNASPTSVTSFTGGLPGAIVNFIALDANTTLVNGTTIKLKGAVNAALPANGNIQLQLHSGAWYEVSRSF